MRKTDSLMFDLLDVRRSRRQLTPKCSYNGY